MSEMRKLLNDAHETDCPYAEALLMDAPAEHIPECKCQPSDAPAAETHEFVGGYEIDPTRPADCQICEKPRSTHKRRAGIPCEACAMDGVPCYHDYSNRVRPSSPAAETARTEKGLITSPCLVRAERKPPKFACLLGTPGCVIQHRDPDSPVDPQADAQRVEQELTGVELIAAERRRQVEAEGWTPEHDDEHDVGEMVSAAMCYSIHASFQTRSQDPPEHITASRWPWSLSWWKPSDDPIRNLVKAGALIAAEIDRLQRLATEGNT